MIFTAFAGEKKIFGSVDAAFVSSKCSVCHKIERVCGKIGEKNPEQWAITVKRMAEKRGSINDTEQKQIVDFLSGLKDSAVLCPK